MGLAPKPGVCNCPNQVTITDTNYVVCLSDCSEFDAYNVSEEGAVLLFPTDVALAWATGVTAVASTL